VGFVPSTLKISYKNRDPSSEARGSFGSRSRSEWELTGFFIFDEAVSPCTTSHCYRTKKRPLPCWTTAAKKPKTVTL